MAFLLASSLLLAHAVLATFRIGRLRRERLAGRQPDRISLLAELLLGA